MKATTSFWTLFELHRVFEAYHILHNRRHDVQTQAKIMCIDPFNIVTSYEPDITASPVVMSMKSYEDCKEKLSVIKLLIFKERIMMQRLSKIKNL